MSPLARLVADLLRHPAPRRIVLLVALGYAGLYLWLTGDLGGGGMGGLYTSFPNWDKALETRGAFQFEPVGVIILGALVWTFSPLNTGLALALGGLVGLNVAAGWRAWRAPRTCRRPGARVGLVAALPALLAGGACCAPVLLIWLGLPIAGAVAGIAPLLIPASALLLLVGLWGLARSLTRTVV